MIEQIIIENYKSIKQASLPLTNLNVLIGSNGAGKSNLISFFELVQSLLNQRLGSYVLRRGGIDRFLYKGQNASDYIKGLIDFNNTNAFFFKLVPSIGNKAFIEYSGDFWNQKAEKQKLYKEWNKKQWDKSVEESEIINKSSARSEYLRDFIRSFTVYHFHDTSITSPMRKSCNLNDNEFLRHDASNLAACLFRLQETEPQRFKYIEGTIRSIAPYFKRFRLKPDILSPNEIKIEWEENESDMYLDAYSFSDGTLRFIALVTLLMQENRPSTIIIDEPELGLHPHAISKLAAIIKKASRTSQIIVATQSVGLVDCFMPQDIIVVERKDQQSVFRRYDKDGLDVWLEDYSLGAIWEKNIIGGQP